MDEIDKPVIGSKKIPGQAGEVRRPGTLMPGRVYELMS